MKKPKKDKFIPKEIDFRRVENINTILKLEKLNQVQFASTINISSAHLNRIIKLHNELTENMAELICCYFPKYRKSWLLGYDPYMTEEEKIRATDLGIRNDAPITVLDTALLNVCHGEGIEIPKLDSLPELMLLTAQLEDYAEMLIKNYIHRKNSHTWNTIDSILETIERNINK